MANETWLTPDEVIEITARKRWSAQCRMLAAMGVPFRQNAVGRPLLERAAFLTCLDGKPGRDKQKPNWGALKVKAEVR